MLESVNTFFVAEIFFLLVLPLAVIFLNKRLFKYRLVVLGLIFMVMLFLSVIKDIPQETLGFQAISSVQVLWYATAGLVGLGFLYVADKFFKIKNQSIDAEIVLSSLVLSFAQEFVFNGYLLNLIKSEYSAIIAVAGTGLAFAFVHQLLERSVASFLVSLFSGVFLAATFLVFPNLYLATLVHSLLNIKALQYRIPGIGPSLKALAANQ